MACMTQHTRTLWVCAAAGFPTHFSQFYVCCNENGKQQQ